MGRGYPKSGTRWPGRNGPDEMSRYEMVLARQLPESTGFWAEHPELLRTPSVTEFFYNEVQPFLTSGNDEKFVQVTFFRNLTNFLA